jgi:hypothetical protein
MKVSFKPFPVEMKGYKNIMNLPDWPDTAYRTMKQETLAGSAKKFLPAAGFFSTGTGRQAGPGFF